MGILHFHIKMLKKNIQIIKTHPVFIPKIIETRSQPVQKWKSSAM